MGWEDVERALGQKLEEAASITSAFVFSAPLSPNRDWNHESRRQHFGTIIGNNFP